ncbi:TPA: hypothetical protein ACXIV3_002235, partial [Enterobacter hormaechei]
SGKAQPPPDKYSSQFRTIVSKFRAFCEALHPPFSSRSLIFKRQKLKHRFNAYLTTLELT